MIWNFIQNEILGMKWLAKLVENFLTTLGVDISTRIGGSLWFFIYDLIKISILLCVLIFTVSFIQSYFPPEKTKKILGKYKGFTANTIAALIGTVTPFCSCSSIPLFIGFNKAGLSMGVSFSFLISSPMVDLASLVLISSIFGARIAIIYVLAGLVIAVIGGSIIEKIATAEDLESITEADEDAAKLTDASLTSMNNPIVDKLIYSYKQVTSTFKKVILYIVIGVGIGAFIHNWIPENLVHSVLGSKNPFAVILATLVGIPMYADIFGTIPVAEALLGKGAQLGSILAFMMAVTTLSLPSLIMLRQVVKPRLLAVFIGICVAGIIFIGYGFNLINV